MTSSTFSRVLAVEVSKDLCYDVTILQKLHGDVSCVVWDSSLVACKYFEKLNTDTPGYFKGKTVLELGSGTGVCSVVLGLLGAKVVATDLPDCLSLLYDNLVVNKDLFDNITNAVRPEITALRWGDTSQHALLSNSFDIILAVDCLYYEASLHPLLKTFMQHSSDETEILVFYELRDIGKPKQIQEDFLKMAMKHFHLRRIPNCKLSEEFCSDDIPALILNRNDCSS